MSNHDTINPADVGVLATMPRFGVEVLASGQINVFGRHMGCADVLLLAEELKRAATTCRAIVLDVEQPTQEHVVSCVARAYSLKPALLMQGGRAGQVATARQVLMWTLGRRGLSHSQIGEFVNRDRTTVLHGCRQIEERRSEDVDFKVYTDAILEECL